MTKEQVINTHKSLDDFTYFLARCYKEKILSNEEATELIDKISDLEAQLYLKYFSREELENLLVL